MENIQQIKTNETAIHDYMQGISKEKIINTKKEFTVDMMTTEIRNSDNAVMFEITTNKKIHLDTIHTIVFEKLQKRSQAHMQKLERIHKDLELIKTNIDKCIAMNDNELQKWYAAKMQNKLMELHELPKYENYGLDRI